MTQRNDQIRYTCIAGGVTASFGFSAAGVAVGVKDSSDLTKKDVALLYTDLDAVTAGVFTTNRVKASPLLLTQERVRGGVARAVVINSGNANSCNGTVGMADARAMAAAAAQAVGVPEEQVLVASTGVIGQPLPMERILSGVRSAADKLSPGGGHDAAEAIMTTDTVSKEAAALLELGGVQAIIGGMAKGSGMIHPNMATMLCFLTTDVAIEAQLLQRALTDAVDQSFNMVSIDGDSSTNDMVVLLANGAAGNQGITTMGADYELFANALTDVCRYLAIAVASDGEGATRLLEVQVRGASSMRDARLIAKSVVSSSLVKAAVFGQDANWGRIICAAGYSGAEINQDKIDIYIGDLLVAKNGAGLTFDNAQAIEQLSGDKVIFTLDLHAGAGEATAWGCDLTYDYVRINGLYRT